MLFFFTIAIILFEVKRKKTYKYYDFLTAVNIYYILYFGIIPSIAPFIDLLKYKPIYAIPQNIIFYYNSTNNFFQGNILIILSYCIIVYGYLIAKKKRKDHKRKVIYDIYISDNKIFITGIITLFISILSLVYYTYSLNGVMNAIKLAEYYRAINSDVQDSFMFLRIFQPLILSSFFCFLVLNKNKSTLRNKVLLISTLFFSCYFLLLNASRYHILIFIFTIVLFNSEKIKMKQVIMMTVLVITGFVFGDTILNFVQTGQIQKNSTSDFNIDSFINTFVSQTIHPYINVLKVPSFIDEISDHRFFGDYVYFLINLLPGSILNLIGISKIEPLWSINTHNFNSLTGGIPVDIISFGYYQLGIIGVIINCLFVGFVLGKINELFNDYNHNAMKILRVRGIFIFPLLVINAEPEVFVRGNLNFIILLFIFYFTSPKYVRVEKDEL